MKRKTLKKNFFFFFFVKKKAEKTREIVTRAMNYGH